MEGKLSETRCDWDGYTLSQDQFSRNERTIAIEGDCNFLYHAVLAALDLDDSQHPAFRAAVWKWVRENKEVECRRAIDEKHFVKRVELISRDKEREDDLELFAIE